MPPEMLMLAAAAACCLMSRRRHSPPVTPPRLIDAPLPPPRAATPPPASIATSHHAATCALIGCRYFAHVYLCRRCFTFCYAHMRMPPMLCRFTQIHCWRTRRVLPAAMMLLLAPPMLCACRRADAIAATLLITPRHTQILMPLRRRCLLPPQLRCAPALLTPLCQMPPLRCCRYLRCHYAEFYAFLRHYAYAAADALYTPMHDYATPQLRFFYALH